ncbi:MAG: glutathione peroxidase [Bacteroidetes bacterium]|nr:glutathione peroxidase [Bacteroidota bacterium]
MKLLLFAFLIFTSPLTIYDFTVESIDGGKIDFSEFKGKKILVVNTASECGNTPQYKQLQKLYEQHKEHLVIVGFPANNFGKQEPGTNEEIEEFCKIKYGVTFPMASKISVVGDDMHEIYQWLTKKTFNRVLDSKVTWNFQKYLIDEQGNLVSTFAPKTDPMSQEILDAINK